VDDSVYTVYAVIALIGLGVVTVAYYLVWLHRMMERQGDRLRADNARQTERLTARINAMEQREKATRVFAEAAILRAQTAEMTANRADEASKTPVLVVLTQTKDPDDEDDEEPGAKLKH
jgi:hypothetical protein